MIIAKKAISRRTVLRGLGTAVALPLLDAMVPALTAAQKTPATAVRRLGVVYHPNGVIYDKWLPKGAGTNFELSPVLMPLEPFRDKLVVVTGLYSDQAEALGDGGGDHSRASGTYLTGVHVKRSDTVVEAGISMDQIAAAHSDSSLNGGKQSSRRFRTIIRRERQHGCPRARGASRAGPEHPGFDHGSRKVAAEEPRRKRQPESERLSRIASRCRAAYPEGRRTKRAKHRESAECRAARRHSR